jgi:hypothetical protein
VQPNLPETSSVKLTAADLAQARRIRPLQLIICYTRQRQMSLRRRFFISLKIVLMPCPDPAPQASANNNGLNSEKVSPGYYRSQKSKTLRQKRSRERSLRAAAKRLQAFALFLNKTKLSQHRVRASSAVLQAERGA